MAMKRLELSHFNEYGIRPFCDQLSLHFRDFFYGYSSGKWKSMLPCNRLICILEDSGESFISDAGETVRLTPGTIVLVPAFHEILHDQSASMRHLSIHFYLRLFCEIDLLGQCDRLYHENDGRRLESINRILANPDRFLLTTAMRGLCWNFISEFALETNFSVDRLLPAWSRYAALFDYFQRHCHAGVNVEQMAEVMHMPRRTFVKKFIYDTGLSPKRYFNRILATKAAEYLAASDMTIREIAEHLQFCNEFYFSRFFKQHLAVSPRDYRRQNRFSPERNIPAERQ